MRRPRPACRRTKCRTCTCGRMSSRPRPTTIRSWSKRVTPALRKSCIRRRTRSSQKIRPWAAKIFANTACPIIPFPAFMFNVGAVDPAKVAESKKNRHAAAEFAFEQIRARARADDSHRHHRHDQRRARADEEIALHSKRWNLRKRALDTQLLRRAALLENTRRATIQNRRR